MEKYDVVIVGAGPAGIFAALELSEKRDLSILVLDKGQDVDKRAQSNSSVNCGWGGAGAFSDGKLTLSTDVGGWLGQYVSQRELAELIDYVDAIYLRFGAPEKVYSADDETIRQLKHKAVLADLTLIPSKIRHLGTENCVKVVRNLREHLGNLVDIRTETQVSRLTTENGMVTGVEIADGELVGADYVITAPGREGADWLTSEARRLGLPLESNAVDIGLRVEVPAAVMEPLTEHLYESKLVYYSKRFEDQVRTFCMCPYGHVTKETYQEVVTVNGHSFRGRGTDNTNFALLVSTAFTEPFHEPTAYGKYIARLANLLGEGIIVQRLGDLQMGRRSTPERIARSTVKPTYPDATPGDLSFVLPYRYISDILEMLQALDKLAPGVNSSNTLLYGVEVKFYSSRVQLKPSLETQIRRLYAIGDGAGITRGLVQASAAGVIAARQILEDKGLA